MKGEVASAVSTGRAWRTALASGRFRALAVGSAVAVLVVLLVLRRFLDGIEARHGVAFDDPFLRLFSPHDVALALFPLMYLALFGLLVPLARSPERLVAGLLAYAAMLVARMIVMDLLPLDPPPTMIPLRDPFVELFGEQRTLTRDLFFSGHTATLFLVTLALPTPRLRGLGAAATVVVAAGVLAQHAHYTVDVVAAPFFAFGAWSFAWWVVRGTSDPAAASTGAAS